MEIKGPGNFSLQNLTDLRQLATAAGSRAIEAARVNWQNGQLLNALVVRQDAKNLLLDVQGQAVLVKNRPEFAFLPGQRLNLQVTQLQPEPAMKLLAPAPRPDAAQQQPIIQQGLKQGLSRQAPLPPLLANLETVARQPQQHPPLPANVRKSAWEIHQLLPDVRQASRADSLRQALERTGPFIQHQLLQLSQGQPVEPQKSLQGALLRLADQIRQQLALAPPRPNTPPHQPATGARPGTGPTGTATTPPAATATPAPRAEANPPAQTAVRPQTPQGQPQQPPSLALLNSQDQGLGELLRQVEGGLARMQLHQLHSVQSDQSGRPLWAMELPIRGDQGLDLFDLRIRQDDPDGNDPEYRRPWSVSLAFDLEGLGPVRVNITLIDQTVSAQFQMQEPSTRHLFDGALEQLRSRLNGVGLEVGQLACSTDMEANDAPAAPGSSGILDEKA